MPLSDIVEVTITTANPGLTAAGFGVPLILSYNTGWVSDRTRSYNTILEVAADFAATTPEYDAAAALFAQDPAPEEIKIGRGDTAPTQRWALAVHTLAVGNIYALAIDNESVSQNATHTAIAGVAWQASTVYATGYLAINDTGKGYICITAGTSAGSGGPTGTAADITDGTVHWMYAGAVAVGAASNDAVVYNLQKAIDALAAPDVSGVGADQVTLSLQGSVAAKTLRILANTAGDSWSVSIVRADRLTLTQDQADPGVAADLALVALADNDWYALVTLYNSYAYVVAAAGWVETAKKLYIAATSDSEVETAIYNAATTTDVASKIKAQARKRTQVFYHRLPGEYADAGELGVFLPKSPGSETWRLKTISGVTAQGFTSTAQGYLDGKNAAYYYSLGGVPVVGGKAMAGSGQYVDVTRSLDQLEAWMQTDIANLLIQNDKIPFTQAGLDRVEATIRAVFARGVRATIIADGTVTLTMPVLADISQADKDARLLAGILASFTLAGAIHKVTMSIAVQQ